MCSDFRWRWGAALCFRFRCSVRAGGLPVGTGPWCHSCFLLFCVHVWFFRFVLLVPCVWSCSLLLLRSNNVVFGVVPCVWLRLLLLVVVVSVPCRYGGESDYSVYVHKYDSTRVCRFVFCGCFKRRIGSCHGAKYHPSSSLPRGRRILCLDIGVKCCIFVYAKTSNKSRQIVSCGYIFCTRQCCPPFFFVVQPKKWVQKKKQKKGVPKKKEQSIWTRNMIQVVFFCLRCLYAPLSLCSSISSLL